MADAPTERRARTPLPKPDQTPKRPRLFGGRFWIVVFVLLAINYLSVAIFAPGRERSVRIPYSPAFLDQVKRDNVKSISVTGATVSAESNKAIKYPPSKKAAKPAKNFDTEIPTFASNTDTLATTLQDHHVEISAEPINQGRGVLLNLILGFGPVILLVALFVWMGRRAAAGGGQLGALGAFGRSRARRVEGAETHVTFDDVAGVDEAKAGPTAGVGFLQHPPRYPQPGRAPPPRGAPARPPP